MPGGKLGSPPTSTEVVAVREATEKAQEATEEEEEAPKSNRLARGKAKVVVPASLKRKNFPKLDEVPRKRRKFMDASATAAAKVCLFLLFFKFSFWLSLFHLFLTVLSSFFIRIVIGSLATAPCCEICHASSGQ